MGRFVMLVSPFAYVLGLCVEVTSEGVCCRCTKVAWGSRNRWELTALQSKSTQRGPAEGLSERALVNFQIADKLLTRDGTQLSLYYKMKHSCLNCQRSHGEFMTCVGFNTANKM